MTDTKISINLSGLDAIRRKLGNKYIAKVGFLGSGEGQEQHKTEDGGTITNAELALVHIFGSISKNIPPRDMLKAPIESKASDVIAFLNSDKIKGLLAEGKIEECYSLLGIFAENIVQEAFDTGGFGKWPALKRATINAKGSSAILIDTGQLRRAVSSGVAKS
jgi:hypothetical protein